MFAGSDEHDFDAESGDDIMVQGESVMRNEGMFGFDWAIFKGVSLDGYADMRIPIFTTEQADILRNRFDKVEALSGWNHDDTLIGDDRVFGDIAPGATVGTTEGVFFNDGLDQAGIDRIAGLEPDRRRSAPPASSRAATSCSAAPAATCSRATAATTFSTATAGSTSGSASPAPARPILPANEIATVDSLKHVFTAADAGDPSWVGKSLFELLIARTIVPNQLHIVREIIEDDGAGDTDVAVFNDVRANYTITVNRRWQHHASSMSRSPSARSILRPVAIWSRTASTRCAMSKCSASPTAISRSVRRNCSCNGFDAATMPTI